jgi:hypothetical protein
VPSAGGTPLSKGRTAECSEDQYIRSTRFWIKPDGAIAAFLSRCFEGFRNRESIAPET